MHVTALILAAGKGLRFKSSTPKPLVIVNKRPLLAYSLAAFDAHPKITDIVVTAGADAVEQVRRCITACRARKPVRLTLGGARRQDSVARGLRALDAACDAVLIHDSARPFVDAGIISRVLQGTADHGACVCGVRVKATIKKVNGGRQKAKDGKTGLDEWLCVRETLKRDELWEIQTPQGFRTDLILRAYEKFGAADVTDDASLVEKMKCPVALVDGSYYNIKVTTPEDYLFAQAIAKRS